MPGRNGIEVRIDRETCMGSGNCAYMAPATFEIDDEGYSFVIDPSATAQDVLVKAAEGCPVGAISLWREGVRLDKGRP